MLEFYPQVNTNVNAFYLEGIYLEVKGGFNCGMDKYEIRRRRLQLLIDLKCGGRNSLMAKKIGMTDSYVSRMLYEEGKAGKKRIGEDSVDKIASAFSLPFGWMDEPDDGRARNLLEGTETQSNVSGPQEMGPRDEEDELGDFFGESRDYVKAYEAAPEYVRNAADQLLDLPEEKQREAARYIKYLSDTK